VTKEGLRGPCLKKFVVPSFYLRLGEDEILQEQWCKKHSDPYLRRHVFHACTTILTFLRKSIISWNVIGAWHFKKGYTICRDFKWLLWWMYYLIFSVNMHSVYTTNYAMALLMLCPLLLSTSICLMDNGGLDHGPWLLPSIHTLSYSLNVLLLCNDFFCTHGIYCTCPSWRGILLCCSPEGVFYFFPVKGLFAFIYHIYSRYICCYIYNIIL